MFLDLKKKTFSTDTPRPHVFLIIFYTTRGLTEENGVILKFKIKNLTFFFKCIFLIFVSAFETAFDINFNYFITMCTFLLDNLTVQNNLNHTPKNKF